MGQGGGKGRSEKLHIDRKKWHICYDILCNRLTVSKFSMWQKLFGWNTSLREGDIRLFRNQFGSFSCQCRFTHFCHMFPKTFWSKLLWNPIHLIPDAKIALKVPQILRFMVLSDRTFSFDQIIKSLINYDMEQWVIQYNICALTRPRHPRTLTPSCITLQEEYALLTDP